MTPLAAIERSFERLFERPSARLVATFPRKEGTYCAVPVIAGHYYLVTVPAWSAVVSLDISDPSAPREVSRARFGETDVPHWIAIAPDHRRVVVTGYQGMKHRVEILRFDPATEKWDSYASSSGVANVRQIHGRKGEVWTPESAAGKLVVYRYK